MMMRRGERLVAASALLAICALAGGSFARFEHGIDAIVVLVTAFMVVQFVMPPEDYRGWTDDELKDAISDPKRSIPAREVETMVRELRARQ